MSIRIVIADNHEVIRQGISLLIEQQEDMEIIAQAQDGRQAVRLARDNQPDMVLLEISMPSLNGIDAARQILKDNPHAKVIVLSGNSDRRSITEILSVGASGYVLKTCLSENLIRAIRTVYHGGRYLSTKIASQVIDDMVHPKEMAPEDIRLAKLTAKERELMQLLSEGKLTKSAAKILHVSIKTIDARRREIMHKLNLSSISTLTKFAIRHGITTLEY